MTDVTGRARSYVDASFPDAVAAFLGGSAGAGTALPTSDLDIVVVLSDAWRDTAFVETSAFEGQVVEAFVYGQDGLAFWLDKGRRDRRPVVDRLIAEGRPLLGTPLESDLAHASRAALDAGPNPLSEDEIRMRRYALSALLDDLEDVAGVVGEADAAIANVVAWTTWTAAAELALLQGRHWLGTGKWLVRELRRRPDPYSLLDWAASDRAPARVLGPARAVLDAAGGHLQAGMMRGTRPEGL